MLGPRGICLGALILLAGCVAPQTSQEASAGHGCLLGGPQTDPPDDREVFNLSADHVDRHPLLGAVFSEEGHTVTVDCEAGVELMDHLSSEGADVLEPQDRYGHDVYLRHEGTTIRVALHAVR